MRIEINSELDSDRAGGISGALAADGLMMINEVERAQWNGTAGGRAMWGPSTDEWRFDRAKWRN